MKKKICVLSLQKAALSKYSKGMLTALDENTYDVYFSKYSETQYNGENAYPIKTYRNSWEFVLNSFFYIPLKVICLIPRFRRKYDILYLPTDGLWNIFFVIVFLFLKKKIVVTVHDARRHAGRDNIILKKLYNFIRYHADHLVFLTEDQRKMLYEDLQLKNKPYSIVPLGIFELEDVIVKEDNIQKGMSKRILFAGRIIKYKGVDILIEAGEQIEDYFERIDIVGKCYYTLRDIKSKKINLHDKYVDDCTLANFLNEADVLVLPYLEATQSAVVTLGINSELPMICSRVNGLAEQLSERECVFVPPGDVAALAEAIRMLCTDDDLFFEKKRALGRLRQSMDWSEVSIKLKYILNCV